MVKWMRGYMGKLETSQYTVGQLRSTLEAITKEITELHDRVMSGESLKQNEISLFHENIKALETILSHVKWLIGEFYEQNKK